MIDRSDTSAMAAAVACRAGRFVGLEPGTTKNDEARNLPLTSGALRNPVDAEVDQGSGVSCPWVFFNEAGGRIGRFQPSCRTACTAAGLDPAEGEADRLFRDLRRSARLCLYICQGTEVAR